ncbi:MAG: maleylpyruvate isomerase N-terminal domain-containing protein [Dehalococcoidia bacterium]|jgi:hypothetical protein|nr:hypothetical protein [Chloroflexota bacterium]MDP6056018.1 maleylpyruvate isomerase N-terminal domain-containing protein [Dehalococcoidia bacterium]MDP7091042.1 maleylpyruvate isomerase N-terminal domain-containing protein [Dehalococcoidia bacterium]MDP7261190.1 maleylpyruvate isomerase N-terminal domain-containing protein [Dehalococcoidia bacterium]MDP7485887.1 maleylpyruvate isomerase N-terminal domain-containing protein [Dehalococcoidia bacterium]|tara:strand:+ start:16477 stop:16935 length:459 start_codon:yes stop_codon:yes gene_type:complete
MKDRKSAVLAAIDDSWRQFRNSLNRLVSEDMAKPGVLEKQSVADIVGHITTWEWELVTSLDSGKIEPVGDVDRFNAEAAQTKSENEPRRTVEEMEQVHRSLRDQLAKAPSAYFEPFDPFREMIDSCTVLHYQEHGAQIRIWAAKNSLASTNN